MLIATSFFTANTTKYIASELGDEMILMNLETGDYVNLNPVSTEIWKQAVREKTTARAIIDYLLEQYEVNNEVCALETNACLEEMVSKELLLIVN